MIDCSRCFWIQCNIDGTAVCLDGSIIDIFFILWKTQILLFDNRCRLYEKRRTLEHIFVIKVIIFVGNNSVSMVRTGSLLFYYLFIYSFFLDQYMRNPQFQIWFIWFWFTLLMKKCDCLVEVYRACFQNHIVEFWVKPCMVILSDGTDPYESDVDE